MANNKWIAWIAIIALIVAVVALAVIVNSSMTGALFGIRARPSTPVVPVQGVEQVVEGADVPSFNNFVIRDDNTINSCFFNYGDQIIFNSNAPFDIRQQVKPKLKLSYDYISEGSGSNNILVNFYSCTAGVPIMNIGDLMNENYCSVIQKAVPLSVDVSGTYGEGSHSETGWANAFTTDRMQTIWATYVLNGHRGFASKAVQLRSVPGDAEVTINDVVWNFDGCSHYSCTQSHRVAQDNDRIIPSVDVKYTVAHNSIRPVTIKVSLFEMWSNEWHSPYNPLPKQFSSGNNAVTRTTHPITGLPTVTVHSNDNLDRLYLWRAVVEIVRSDGTRSGGGVYDYRMTVQGQF